MSSRSLVPPIFSVPPESYQVPYFNDLIRGLSLFVDQQQQPGEGRHTTMVFTDLSSNDVGLETGSVFEVDGFLKISRANNPHVSGNVGTGAVGSVTVTIT